MAKKKDKKKEKGKKKNKQKDRKKKNLKKKDLAKKDKKKELKKAQLEKKRSEKKSEGKKKGKKKDKKKGIPKQEPLAVTALPKLEKPKVPAAAAASVHSSKYNVRNALIKLRTLKNPEQVRAFTKGEKRKTIIRAVAPVLRKFGT
jgi:hypothetical protein